MNKIYKICFLFTAIMALLSIIIYFFRSRFWLIIKDMTIDELAQYFIDNNMYIPVMVIVIALTTIVIFLIRLIMECLTYKHSC